MRGANTHYRSSRAERRKINQSVCIQKNNAIIIAAFITTIWYDDAVDIILLTSEQSLNHLFKLFDVQAHQWLLSKVYLVISNRIAQAARNMGIKKIILSHPKHIVTALLGYKD